MATATPPEEQLLEGTTVMLSMNPEEQKGEVEGEVFRIVKFQREKPDSLSLTDVVLHVQLFCKKFGSFFKAIFDNPAEISPDHKVPMDIVIYNLQEILSGKAENTHMAFEKDDGKETLLIIKSIKYPMFNTTVSFKFCYKFHKAKMSFEEHINMRLAEIHQDINKMKSESSLEEIERKLNMMHVIIGKPIDARFVVDKNPDNSVEDEGKSLVRRTGSGSWRTIPVSFAMTSPHAYRARFLVATMQIDDLMFGVVNSSFSDHNTYPEGPGWDGWMVHFDDGERCSTYANNGTFKGETCCAPLSGSTVTVEYYPKYGRIQYFVDKMPAGRHDGCSFTTNGYFAVSNFNIGQKLKLLSMEEISDIF